METLDTVLAVALDLTAALTTQDRYRRLLEAMHRVIPYDAAALLRLEGQALVPLVVHGMTPDVMGRGFALAEHPRLAQICSSPAPVRFPADSPLPDPFDGLVLGASPLQGRIHACLGCPLHVDGKLIGALTADALAPGTFDGIDLRFLAALGALAGAMMRTTNLIEALERSATRQGSIARDLMRDAQLRHGSQLIGNSPALERLRKEIALVGRSDFAVLITGETGVGKELVARAVHAASARREEPLLYVNCAALPESLADSELFGHVRGAFTGASSDRPGKFEVADRGTLFLDEVGELPLPIQPKLLRALQEGEIQRVGTDKQIRVDVRLLAATNRELELEVKAGRFRADLYHRLHVYPLHVPPLRERREDIPVLAGFFCDQARRRLGLGPVRLAPEAVAALLRYDWPGNVRELENVLSRSTLRAAAETPRGEPIVLTSVEPGGELVSAVPGLVQASPADPEPGTAAALLPGLQPGLPLRQAVDDFQRVLILREVAAQGGSWSAAARQLGLHRSNLHHLARRLGLK